MATAKKAAKPKPKATKSAVKKKARKTKVKKKATKPAERRKATKRPAAKKKVAAKKKATRPAVKKKAARPAARKRPAAKKKSSASSAANAKIKALQKQILGLKNDVRAANRRADALGKLSAKRGAAIARFVSGWDRKANSAAARSAKPRKKK